MLYFITILFMLHTSQCDEINNERRKIEWCKPLRQRIPPGEVVALASFPGSGNTWLRYLLQQATGIETGSIYLDTELYMNGFPAETISNGSVLVVKTHENDPPPNCKSVILLIRNPRDTLLASYNYVFSESSNNSHIMSAPKSDFIINTFAYTESRPEKKDYRYFINENMTQWQMFVFREMLSWEAFYISWLTSFGGSMHIVFYRALVENTRSVLKEILKFINFNVSESDLNCVTQRRDGIYRRVKLKNFDPFDEVMYQKLDIIEERMTATIKAYINDNNVSYKYYLLSTDYLHNKKEERIQKQNKATDIIKEQTKKIGLSGSSSSSGSARARARKPTPRTFGLMLDLLNPQLHKHPLTLKLALVPKNNTIR